MLNTIRQSMNVAMLKFREGTVETVPTYKQLVSKYYFGDPSVISRAGLSNSYGSDWVLYGLTIGVVSVYIVLMTFTKLSVWWVRRRSNKLSDSQSLPSLTKGASSKSERMMLSM
eukprot:scaffold227430_cov14-Tisochrysis_lutea.AAC.1